MVVPAQQSPVEGLWFSADVVFATLTVTGATFAVDLATPTIGSSLDLALEAVSGRGNVIGLRVTSDTVAQLIVDYGQAYGTSGTTVGNQTAIDVLTEVEAAIDLNAGLSASAFTNVGTDFTAG